MTDCTQVPTLDEIYQAKKNITDLDTFANSTAGTFVDSDGVTKTTLMGIINAIKSAGELAVLSIGWDPVGEFSTGFTYTKLNDVGRDISGSWWRYNGSDLPKVIIAGTVPSSPNFSVISFETADNVSKRGGGSVQDFIDAQCTTVAELATGKFQVGTYVRLTDRANGVFLVQTGGTPNGKGILSAGGINTAVLQENGTIIMEWLGFGATATPAFNSSVINENRVLLYGKKLVFTEQATVDIDAPFDCDFRADVYQIGIHKIRKTTATVGSKTRTITPAGLPTQTYTFNKNVIVNVIPEDNSINYAIYFNWHGNMNICFETPSNGSVGIFDRPMAAYCDISGVTSNYSGFFLDGIDNWQCKYERIRSRFSNRHFNIELGTSNDFTLVACDGSHPGASARSGFTLGCYYSHMSSCAADGLTLAYDFYGNAEVVMTGCGSEGFGRSIRTRGNSKAIVNGGQLGVAVTDSNQGLYSEPWLATDNSRLTFNGVGMQVSNFSLTADTAALAQMQKPLATGNALFIVNDSKLPYGYKPTPNFSGDTFIVIGDARAIKNEGESRTVQTAKVVNASKPLVNSVNKVVSVTNATKTLLFSATLPYGTVTNGKLLISLYSSYSGAIGVAGNIEALFAASGIDSDQQRIVTIESNIIDFSAAQPTPTVLLETSFVGDLFSIFGTITSGGGSLLATEFDMNLEYTARTGNVKTLIRFS